jgi:hypothetical protein
MWKRTIPKTIPRKPAGAPVRKIRTRDGKVLDVNLTLKMAREHVALCEEEPDEHGVEGGLALALEAALVALKEVSR